MGSAATRPYLAGSADIRLEYGIAQTFALKFPAGKQVESRFPGGRVMFTAIDDRRLFLDDEDASDLERTMRELGIGPSDFMRVTKIRHARGGGHSIRVERVEDADPDTRHAARIPAQPARRLSKSKEEALLEKSLGMGRAIDSALERARAMQSEGASEPAPFAPLPEEETPAPAAAPTRSMWPKAAAAAPAADPASARMAACFKAAIDAIAEAQAYAHGKALGITFTAENVTSAALSAYINGCKGGAR